jgi:primosomal protein N'
MDWKWNVKRKPKLLSIEDARKIARTVNIETQFNLFLANEMTKEDMLTLIDLNWRTGKKSVKFVFELDKDTLELKKDESKKIKELNKLAKNTAKNVNDVSDLINFVSSYEA